MTEPTLQVEILRYRPETDQDPAFQTYTVPYRDDWVVLDALNHIKDNIDRTLSYRWSCHMAVCGSCGMMINGEPKLSCHAFLRDYYPNKIRVEPLNNFPIERDLVTVTDDFMEKLESVKPYVIPKQERAVDEGPHLQTPAQLNTFKQYTMCINCLLCYAACPQYGLTPDFVGPAALALAHRYNLDTRDAGREQRQEIAASNEGVWDCTFVGECSQVCPKSVDPAAAIQQTKIASTIDWYKALLNPWGKR
ncbi:MAG: succinate dehydrogenase/fumarate reductase iron-sulfur subunit [Rhodospirillales bacterium]|nr:succinate dehydrogenase/fumarate reductase iron-sulfur subunit [Rhodospirillales bacterium]MDH3792344.1 succinate dehydrogenase/fumarate reductase iron-sulfur subunit [Rhodospirillales bacterium]MDH3912202.1 succinate dehydrogenase/fumarate reductase iron-sulfur subunit [Rhodospirillales bacterium]MDH3968465.1 succinate dehydrogenase/fumarate reductase iron-sulfur subunit [Rhodospirillales bacterium]